MGLTGGVAGSGGFLKLDFDAGLIPNSTTDTGIMVTCRLRQVASGPGSESVWSIQGPASGSDHPSIGLRIENTLVRLDIQNAAGTGVIGSSGLGLSTGSGSVTNLNGFGAGSDEHIITIFAGRNATNTAYLGTIWYNGSSAENSNTVASDALEELFETLWLLDGYSAQMNDRSLGELAIAWGITKEEAADTHAALWNDGTPKFIAEVGFVRFNKVFIFDRVESPAIAITDGDAELADRIGGDPLALYDDGATNLPRWDAQDFNHPADYPPSITIDYEQLVTSIVTGDTAVVFPGVTVDDFERADLDLTITIDDTGVLSVFESADNTALGLSDEGGGVWTFTGDQVEINAVLSALLFVGVAEGITLVEIAVDDGTTETTESVLVSVNDPDLTSLLPNNTWDFGTLASGDSTVSKQFYIRDIVAAVNMEIGQEMGEDPAISGSGSSYFSIDAGDNPDGDTIAPGDDATITIVCDPAGATGGVQSATLSIPYNNAVQSPLEITLSFTASSSEDGGGILSRNRRRRLFPRKRALE